MVDKSHIKSQPISGLSDIIDRYDGLLVDLWGCVHNGIAPFPEAVNALLNARSMGKAVCLLSNGPRRASVLIQRLDDMGVPREAYQHAMSSGEATWSALAERADPFHASLGERCFRLGPPRDESVHTDNNLILVDKVADADFVLCTGIFHNTDSVADYEALFDEALGRNLPMVCANPDLVVHIGERLSICAGSLAERYRQRGGAVVYHGKPHASVYHQCFRLTGISDTSRLLAIGDGLRTDVLGANRMGIDALFLSSGIHIDALGDGIVNADALLDETTSIGAYPQFVIPKLAW